MKAQSSIEFISLLSLSLLISSILLADLETKTAAYTDQREFQQVEKIVEEISYKLSYVSSHRNSTVYLGFSPALEQTYIINLSTGLARIKTPTDEFNLTSRYRGKNNLSFNTSKSYALKYDGGVEVE